MCQVILNVCVYTKQKIKLTWPKKHTEKIGYVRN